MSLDRGTKIYAGVLGGILLLGLIAWLMSLDFRLGEIDEMLREDPQIAAYPYPFHVLQIAGTTAYVSTDQTFPEQQKRPGSAGDRRTERAGRDTGQGAQADPEPGRYREGQLADR
ncbi:MAG: hypothetical protein P8101_08190 [Candidatus Thiodiazotropha sp.]